MSFYDGMPLGSSSEYADAEMEIKRDGEGFRLIVDSRLTAPTFNSRGAAAVYAKMIRSGQRKPEWIKIF